MSQIKYNVYGRIILTQKSEKGWNLYYLGDEGKMRPAADLMVPSFIEENELEEYLSDICHEWVTDKHPEFFRIE